MSEWKRRYNQVINSSRWRRMRQRYIELMNYQCERCHGIFMPKELDLHHRTYESLGRERWKDIELLCLACHQDADNERAEKSRSRSSTALYNAQLDGWATKRYGADWETLGDPWQIESEFMDWLDSHDR